MNPVAGRQIHFTKSEHIRIMKPVVSVMYALLSVHSNDELDNAAPKYQGILLAVNIYIPFDFK